MTPMERLLMEELPTGTFGGALPPPPSPEPPEQTWPRTPAHVAAEHRRILSEALSGRHLYAVPPTGTTTAAADNVPPAAAADRASAC
ncbi:hypothetical protein AB0M05_41445 [Streptomyces violaceusniger]|uniref:hypothetical protein n=1 Tax=Streptomyces violaceusniger TaxID=68280 RepID=UPI00343B8ED4